MDPISVEVIAPTVTDLFHCLHCEAIFDRTEVGPRVHREIQDEYPQDLKDDFQRLSAWLIELVRRYGDAVRIKLTDPQSAEGFVKCVRHRVRRYPAFIVAGRKRYVGWDKTAVDQVLRDSILAARSGSGGQPLTREI